MRNAAAAITRIVTEERTIFFPHTRVRIERKQSVAIQDRWKAHIPQGCEVTFVFSRSNIYLFTLERPKAGPMQPLQANMNYHMVNETIEL